MSQQTESAAIRLSQPAAGQTVIVPVDADNMRFTLGFEPDPNAVEKNGQNLEFSFPDGGRLVLEGYYDHFADKTLPVMVTEAGDELPGEDFLASLREDLLTAAGPGAGGAPGGGSGEYADDPGALIAGIDRLGDLGTIYWGVETEVPEFYEGMETPVLLDLPVDEVTPPVASINIAAGNSDVYESQLPNGTLLVNGEKVDDPGRRTAGGTISTEGELAQGNITFNLPDGDSIAMELPLDGGVNSYDVNGNSFTITNVGNGDYEYKYTLNSPVIHSKDGETESVTIDVNVVDVNGNEAQDSFQVTIHDDGITATEPEKIVLTEKAPVNYDVTIAFDMSYSMNYDADSIGSSQLITEGKDSRFDLAKQALIDLMNTYDNARGCVKVNLVLFTGNSKVAFKDYTPEEALAFIKDSESFATPTYAYTTAEKVNSSGLLDGTNYNHSLNTVQNLVDENLVKYDGYEHQVFFMTDGDPTVSPQLPSSDPHADPFVSDEWKEYVKEKGDKLDVFSVGMGAGLTETAEDQLQSVCNPNDSGDKFIIVDDMHDLSNVLQDLASVAAEGNLVAENILGADGVESFYGYKDADGEMHEFGTEGHEADASGFYSVILAGSKDSENYTEMKINGKGDYILTVHGDVTDEDYNNIHIVLRDNDGNILVLPCGIEVRAYEEPPMVMSRSVMDDDVLGEHHFSLTGLVDDIKHNEIDKLLDNPVQAETAGEHAFTNDFYSPPVDTGIDEAARAAQQIILTTM